MTGFPRTIGLVLALSVLSAPGWATLAPAASAIPCPTAALAVFPWTSATAADVDELFKEAVALLNAGKKPEALKKLQEVLAANPTNEQAYELWKTTDHQVWLDILTERGEFELIAKRLWSLAEMGKTARKNDAGAIQSTLEGVRSQDPLVSRKARNTLASEHGEFAVPFMLPTLEEQGNDDRRVLYMHTLTEMDRDVVIPLIEALGSPNAFLRRNVALVLGYIGDRRAAAMLAHVAKTDEDGGARSAAETALAKCGGSGDALAQFLQLGQEYTLRQDSVLAAHMYSDVVWNWSAKGLVSSPVARAAYADEMAKKSYQRALAVDAGSLPARAGLARAYASQWTKLGALQDSGADMSAMAGLMETDAIGLGLIGADALDAALQAAVETGDAIAGRTLIQSLAKVTNAPSAGLSAALNSRDGAMRSEAAVALANQAVAARMPVSAQVVATLGEAVGREVVRTVFVIDGNADQRNAAMAQAEKLGFAAMGAEFGANAIALLHRVPGVDAVLVTDSLADLTTFQVIDDLRADPRFEKTPIFVVSANAEQAKEIFGERASGVLAAGGDMAAVAEAVGPVSGDRAMADRLAGDSAMTLAHVASAGGDISPAVAGLMATLKGREDSVSTRAMGTLGMVGDSTHVSALVAVLKDGGRSEAARTAAADALASIFTRGAGVSAEDMMAISGTVKSDAPMGVRTAAARAMGAIRLEADVRAELLRSARSAGAQG